MFDQFLGVALLCYNEEFKRQVLENSKIGASKTILTLEVKDIDGLVIGVFQGYEEAANVLGLHEKTIRNIASRKFKTSRSGYTVTAIAKAGVAI